MKILAFAVAQEANRFLMIQEASRKWKKKWHFPGGHLTSAETIEEAVIRETCDETGLKITVHGVVHAEFIKRALGWNQVHIYLSASPLGGSLKKSADEHSLKAGWKSVDEIIALDLRDNSILNILSELSYIEPLPLSHFKM